MEVLRAANGVEALELLDDSVDVLVLDRSSFDGRIVVVSADEQDAHLDEADVTEYITKPSKREQLLAQLRQWAAS